MDVLICGATCCFQMQRTGRAQNWQGLAAAFGEGRASRLMACRARHWPCTLQGCMLGTELVFMLCKVAPRRRCAIIMLQKLPHTFVPSPFACLKLSLSSARVRLC